MRFNPSLVYITPELSENVIQGKGRSRGIETWMEYKSEKIHFWTSYTLSKSERSFNQIQAGEWFTYSFDRTHVLNAVANFRVFPQVFVNVAAQIQSGTVITLPQGFVPYSFLDIGNFLGDLNLYANVQELNNFRLPNYLRFDVSASYTPRGVPHMQLDFGAYNVFNRNNVIHAYFSEFRVNSNRELVGELANFYLFGIVPFITISYEF